MEAVATAFEQSRALTLAPLWKVRIAVAETLEVADHPTVDDYTCAKAGITCSLQVVSR
jgi:hypothetical protein